MARMIYTILLSLIAVASADKLSIVNNCGVEYRVSSIYFPTGTGIQCYKMRKIAAGGKLVLDNFFPDEDVVLLNRKPITKSLEYIDTLKAVMGKEEDIDGMCSKIVKSGDIRVYSVKTGVTRLVLCADKPKPSSRRIFV